MLHFFNFLRRSLTRDDSSSFAAPAQFGPYRVLHQIGVGALGPVFRTYEPDRDRLVAVKAFRIDLTPEQAQSLADELSRVANAGLFHPSIVEPISAGVEGTVAYSAEEYVAAESLDVAMRHYAPAPIDTVLPFVTQLAGAIDFARAAGVGHGGLHPRDMFMTPDEARVTGFGVVDALARVGFRAPVRRPYSAPERIAGDSWGTPADVFSLAAVTFELLTGRRPAGLGSEIGSLPSADPAAHAVHAVLVRAMDESPARRYPTALAFVSALEAAAHGRVATDVPAAEPSPSVQAGSVAASVPGSIMDLRLSTEEAGSDTRDVPASRDIAPLQEMDVRTASRETRGLDEVGDFSEVHLTRDLSDTAEVSGIPGIGAIRGGAGTSEDRELGEIRDVSGIRDSRDEDAAHQQLSLTGLIGRGGADTDRGDLDSVKLNAIDEDVEPDAGAAGYSSDEFLIDVAGAASTPDRSRLDEFRPHAPAAELPPAAPAKAMSPESAAPPAVRAQQPREKPPLEEWRPRGRPQPVVPVTVPPPMFGHHPAEDRAASSGRWPLAVMILVALAGLVAGFGGGYMLWGRSTPAPGSEIAAKATPQQPAGDAGRSSPGAPEPESAGGAAATSGSAEPAPPPPAISESAPSKDTGAAARNAAGRGAPPARARPGRIVVRSTPSRAGVTVNGRWRGRTPLELEELPLARYEVRVVQPGYAAAQQAVTLSADEPERTVSVRLQPAAPAGRAAGRGRQEPPAASQPGSFTGTVYVDSRPRGAKVYIDGKEVGTTPLSIPDVRIGTHVVRLELPDHRIWTATTRVSAGQQSRVTGSLERIQ